MKILVISGALVGLSTFLNSCSNPLDVLGPGDKPKLVSDEWSQIQVNYWIHTRNQSEAVERTFIIDDPAAIRQMKLHLTVDKTEGLSIGTGDQLIFKGAKGNQWHGDIVFEDTLYLSLSSDAWKSYKFTLRGVGFYNQIRDACVTNEKHYHPDATIKHIKLRGNLAADYPRFEN